MKLVILFVLCLLCAATKAQQIAAADYSTCAIGGSGVNAGLVQCTGSSYANQRTAPSSTKFVQISGGSQYYCGLRSDNKQVECCRTPAARVGQVLNCFPLLESVIINSDKPAATATTASDAKATTPFPAFPNALRHLKLISLQLYCYDFFDSLVELPLLDDFDLAPQSQTVVDRLLAKMPKLCKVDVRGEHAAVSSDVPMLAELRRLRVFDCSPLVVSALVKRAPKLSVLEVHSLTTDLDQSSMIDAIRGSLSRRLRFVMLPKEIVDQNSDALRDEFSELRLVEA